MEGKPRFFYHYVRENAFSKTTVCENFCFGFMNIMSGPSLAGRQLRQLPRPRDSRDDEKKKKNPNFVFSPRASQNLSTALHNDRKE